MRSCAEIEKMLEIAGKDIDFLADRADAGPTTRAMIEKVREYNASHGTAIKYCDTEWLAYNTETKRDAYNMACGGDDSQTLLFRNRMYVLALLHNLLTLRTQ